jgi:copper(I)-binding protein
MSHRLSLQFAAAIVLTIIAILTAFSGRARAADADPVVAGDLEISAGWARAMLPGQPTGGGYLTIANKGGEDDRLVAATSPTADKVEIHSMEIVNDVMVMRAVVGGVAIPAGAAVELRPGGLHLMFFKVSEAFKDGDSVAITLEFEKAGKVEVALPVRKSGGDHSGHGAAH